MARPHNKSTASSHVICMPTGPGGVCTCLLRNVCVDAREPVVLQVASPPPTSCRVAARPVPIGAEASISRELRLEYRPEASVSAGSAAAQPLSGLWVWIDRCVASPRVRVRLGVCVCVLVSSDSEFACVWNNAAVLLRYVDYNYAHTMGDEVFAAWRMLGVWGRHSQGDIDRVRSVTDLITPSSRQWGMLSAVPPTSWSSLHAEHGSRVCFEEMAVGSSYMGYSYSFHTKGVPLPTFMPPFHVSMDTFRSHSLKTLGAPTTTPDDDRARVFVVEKGDKPEHGHAVTNWAEVVAALQAALPHHVVESGSWKDMPLRQQAATVSRADVMVAQAGSDVMNAVWLQPQRSELIIVCRTNYMWESCDDPGVMECGLEDMRWMSRFLHHRQCLCEFQWGTDVTCVPTRDDGGGGVAMSYTLDPTTLVPRVLAAVARISSV